MADTKQSITFKVIIGYLLIAALAAVAVWFVYSQVVSYTEMAETTLSSNKKLYLVGDAATNLYEAESLSRQLIQTGNPEDLELYTDKIEDIRLTLDSLKQTYLDTLLKKEIDSINLLLSQKTSNLSELLELRQQEGNQSYYAKVIAELQKMDGSFNEPDYNERFPDLEPHQRRVLVKLLEYSSIETPNQQITNETLDSLINSVKSVLIDFEMADRRYRETLRAKENELLTNEININAQLRNLLSTIEEEEREASLAQVASSQEMIRETSETIAILGAASFLVILIFLFLVVRDVTRSQRYRKQLEDANQYAEELLQSREQFMATVTHDLRSPLNTVAGYISLLENTTLNHSQSHYLDHLKKSSDYILRLVNDLLDLAKLEAGKMTIEYLPFNPKNLIEDTVQGAIPVQNPEKVAVKIAVSQALDRPVISDPFRIKQILINLVTNACKFTEEGNITVKASLERAKPKNYLIISVKDTGIGISEDKKIAIFEEFSQEDSSIEKRFGGSGLGLAISKKLTELLKGNIDMESEAGKGSEFTVKFPVEIPDTSDLPVTEERTGFAKNPSDLSVLIVDDEPAQLSLISEFIKMSGMAIETSNNGKEALKILKKKHFDIVLTDIQMPEMDGFELLKAIEKEPATAEVPVVALSGKSDIAPSQYLEEGFSGSLLKPYSSRRLLEILENILQVNLTESKGSFEKSTPSSPNYSLEEVRMFAGGEKAALQAILTAFIKSSTENLKSLERIIEAGENEDVSAIAHKMLPMFRQLQARSIVNRLDYLENTPPENIGRQHLNELRSEIDHLLEEIQEEIIN